MLYEDPHFVHTLQQTLEFIGTFAFAISGIRLAADRHFDWFGGFVCGFAVAIGGGTVRDVMLGVKPFWMTSTIYILITFLAQLVVIVFNRYVNKLNHAWLLFDTLGLALFTIAGIQKTLSVGHPFWVAIIMGSITGAAGGIIRDVLLNQEPVIFKKEIYAIACIVGGFVYWGLYSLHFNIALVAVTSFLVVCLIRLIAVRYHISLPVLNNEDD